jgi:hypothetical protein
LLIGRIRFEGMLDIGGVTEEEEEGGVTEEEEEGGVTEEEEEEGGVTEEEEEGGVTEEEEEGGVTEEEEEGGVVEEGEGAKGGGVTVDVPGFRIKKYQIEIPINKNNNKTPAPIITNMIVEFIFNKYRKYFD